MISSLRMRLTKSKMKLEDPNENTIDSNLKSSQLKMLRMNFVIQLKMIWKMRLNLMFMNSMRSLLNK